MPAPRWTYTEANAAKWRHLFDELIEGSMALEVPLEGNGKSLCSLRIRITDALKWLADRFRSGDPTNGALRPSEGPPALQSSRLSAPPSSSAASCFPGYPTHFTKHPLTTH